MRDQLRRLLAKLAVLALLLTGVYFVAAPPDRANAAPKYRGPCDCYNELHERMGVQRPGGCDPIC